MPASLKLNADRLITLDRTVAEVAVNTGAVLIGPDLERVEAGETFDAEGAGGLRLLAVDNGASLSVTYVDEIPDDEEPTE